VSRKRDKRKKQKAAQERTKVLERRRSKDAEEAEVKKIIPKARSIQEEEKWREEKGVIHCWKCHRTLQAPDWVRAIAEQNSGEKTNTCALECPCGEKTNYKF